ncbi:CorA family divalent cation transporter [Streptomyces huasconensis]|uniref:CorA family divalent cation transporter n=1 Tax=Streptomyces huasconensis TaxID=1854574 RepID=A0ABV3LY23_9ACTN
MSDIPDDVTVYLRDVADHRERANEAIAGFDELVTGMRNASIAQLSVQQNADMRKISAMAALIAVPTMIVGICGMNFKRMPELTWVYGHPGVMTVIVVCGLVYRAPCAATNGSECHFDRVHGVVAD